MWQVYQYGQGKLKLVKDQKSRQPNTRVSLIDKQQFSDLDKIFGERKDYYQIEQRPIDKKAIETQMGEQQVVGHLSYQEKLELYRKKLQNEKLENKYNNLFKKTERRRFNMRKPYLHKLLVNFQQTYKPEESFNLITDLKQSEKYLQLIKINHNRKATFKVEPVAANTPQRSRFISLQSSLPQKNIKTFPKWQEYAQGCFVKNDNEHTKINIQHMAEGMQTYIQKMQNKKITKSSNSFLQPTSPKRMRKNSKHEHPDTVPILTNNQSEDVFRKIGPSDLYARSITSNIQNRQITKPHQQHLFNRSNISKSAQAQRFSKKFKRNVLSAANKTFTKSENCSKRVVDTMSGFYHSRSAKKKDYENMMSYLKNDRPLTSSIRRKNYTVVGKQSIKEVRQYRNLSEKERLRLKNCNYEFYMGLLEQMRQYSVEQLPLSGKIIEAIRVIVQSNYLLHQQHVAVVQQIASKGVQDFMSKELVRQLEKYALSQQNV